MMQHALKSSLKKFEQEGEAAVKMELSHLHMLITFYSVEADKTQERRRRRHQYNQYF